MKFNFFALLFLLTLMACGKSGGSGTKASSCDMLCEAGDFTLPLVGDDEVPPEALLFQANLTLANFDQSQEEKVLKAAELIKSVIASVEFKKAVLNFRYNGAFQFANNNGLTNKQIYDRILIGAEKLLPTRNSAMDVELELYFDNSTTIGYTYANTTRIWMNTKYFNTYTPVSVSSNLMHEWLHKLGFGHDVSATPERPYSVPYAIGYIVRDLAAKYY